MRLMATLAAGGLLALGLPVAAATGAAAAEIPPGVVPPAANPALPQSCGLDFELVLDVSSSISSAGAEGEVIDAADAFLGAMADTGSRAAAVAFSTGADLIFGPTAVTGSTSVGNPFAIPGLGSFTNWTGGLELAHDQFGVDDFAPDLVVMITDGNPNSVGQNEYGDELQAINAAIVSANGIKAEGTHVFTVGVTSEVDELKLQAVSGTSEFPGTPFETAGWTVSDSYAELGQTLRDVAVALCGGSIVVHKEVGDSWESHAPAAGWPFSTEDTDVTPAEGVTDEDGTLVFDVAGFDGAQSRDITLTEGTANNGSTLIGVRCGPTVDDAYGSDGATVEDRSWTVPVDRLSTVHCVVLNSPAVVDVGIAKDYALPEGVTAVDTGTEFDFLLTVSNLSGGADGVSVTDQLPEGVVPNGEIGIDPADALWQADVSDAGLFTASYDGTYAEGAETTFTIPVVYTGQPVTDLPNNPETPPAVEPAVDLTNEACVVADGDANPANDCASVEVPTKAIQANAYVQCINDVPWLYYDIQTTGSVEPGEFTVHWQPPYGEASWPDTVIPFDEPSGRVIWPYGEVDENGISVAWPGWRLAEEGDVVGQGTIVDSWENMVKDTSLPSYPYSVLAGDPNYPVDEPVAVTFEINPSQTVLTYYPMATPSCAVPRESSPQIVKTASVESAQPGDAFDYTLAVTNPGLGATQAMELFDEIPADLKVVSIETAPAPAFPRWDDCAVVGADSAGYGGALHCVLNGQIGGNRPDAPNVVLSVQLNPKTTATRVANTGEACWNDLPDDQIAGELSGAIALNPDEPILCADSTVEVVVGATGLSNTGFNGGGWLWLGGGVILAGGLAIAFVQIRRRRSESDHA